MLNNPRENINIPININECMNPVNIGTYSPVKFLLLYNKSTVLYANGVLNNITIIPNEKHNICFFTNSPPFYFYSLVIPSIKINPKITEN